MAETTGVEPGFFLALPNKIPPPDANSNNSSYLKYFQLLVFKLIYSCVPGILHNTPDGVIISPLELYSEPNSERRPKLKMGSSNMVEVLMDKGPINDYK